MENSVVGKRIEKLRNEILKKDIDAVLVSKRENYLYLSRFTGSSAHLIITQNATILFTDFRYVEQAEGQALLYDIVEYHGDLMESINQVLKEKNIKKLGFEESYITYDRYLEIKKKLCAEEILPLNGVIEELRIVKDKDEIELIKNAVKIADDAFSHIIKIIKPDITELDIAAELEYVMKKAGAKGPSFETIVASGKRSSLPHGIASSKKINMGDTITMDFGAIFDDYCSDMTRTIFLGEPDSEIKKIYGIVKEAQLKALEEAKAEFTGSFVDTIARDYINKCGYEKCFGHGLGHGVGLEIHEQPRLSPSGNIKLKNNMIVTVEPGIYINEKYGVRIEDMIVICDENPIILTKSTKEMIVL